MSSDDQPELRLAAQGGSGRPTPEQIVYRLRAGTWADDAPSNSSTDPLRRLLASIDDVADAVDSQGPLAPDWLNKLEDDAVGNVFAQLSQDRQEAMDHREVDGRCSVDGQTSPCEVLQGLLHRYVNRQTR